MAMNSERIFDYVNTCKINEWPFFNGRLQVQVIKMTKSSH